MAGLGGRHAWIALGTVVVLAGSAVMSARRTHAMAYNGFGGHNQAVLRHVATSRRDVALTFDDGPDPRFTPAILTILRRYHAHATFFVVGENVLRWPELAREELAEGNEIGNHTFSHPDLSGLSPAQVVHEIRACDLVVENTTARMPVFLRPPYERVSPAVVQAAASLGKEIILSNVTSEHPEDRTPAEIVIWVIRHARPGAIIVAHDGREDRRLTVKALPGILKRLEAEGYRIVPLGALLRSKPHESRQDGEMLPIINRRHGRPEPI